MKSRSSVPLAPLTTFRIGGPARVFVEAANEKDIHDAIAYARELKLPIVALGAGSNLLVPDEGVEGVVLKIAPSDCVFENNNDQTFLIASAGTLWEKVVDAASEQNLFGIENLAGIPGTIGGAAVQNIGAYGTELSESFAYADCLNTNTGVPQRVTRDEAAFSYRTSFFKTHREFLIVRVALLLSKQTLQNSTHPDFVLVRAAGIPLQTPSEIVRTVRAIRAEKFPSSEDEGTAGSFFKNPVIPADSASSLGERFPGLPVFPQDDGTVKASLAWILDHVLSLKGFSKGGVRLYEKQPLVVVARAGATAKEVIAFTEEIAARVFSATGIPIEREVEIFGTR